MFGFKGRAQGSIDGFTAGFLKGWLFDPKNQRARLEYYIEIDGSIVCSGVAGQYREDLLSAKIGDGAYGFSAYIDPIPNEGSLIRLLDASLNLVSEYLFVPYLPEDWRPDVFLLSKDRFSLDFQLAGFPIDTQIELQLFCEDQLLSYQSVSIENDVSSVTLGVPRILFDGQPKFLSICVSILPVPVWKGNLVFEAYEKAWPQKSLSQAELDGYATLPESGYRYSSLVAALDKANSPEFGERVETIIEAHNCLYHDKLKPQKPLLFEVASEENVSDVTMFVHGEINLKNLTKTISSLVLARCNLRLKVYVLDWTGSAVDDSFKMFPELNLLVPVADESFDQYLKNCSACIRADWLVLVDCGIELTNDCIDFLVESLRSEPNSVASARPIAGYSVLGAKENTNLSIQGYATRRVGHLHTGVVALSQETFRETLNDIKQEGMYLRGIAKFLARRSSQVIEVGTSEYVPLIDETGTPLELSVAERKQETILVVDYDTPRPNMDAGSYAAIQEIKLLQALGYKVIFLPILLNFQGKATRYLMKLGIDVLIYPHVASLDEAIEYAWGEGCSFVYMTRYSVAERVLPVVKRQARKVPTILNNADLHFLREMRAAIAKSDNTALNAVELTRERELKVYSEVDMILCYTEIEKTVISSHILQSDKISICPWVVESYGGPKKTHVERVGIAFLGGFLHEPNILGVQYFVAKVMPLLVEADPTIQLFIYGSHAPEHLWTLESENVKVVGYVEDLADVYLSHRVFVAPLTSGAGLKGKVIESMAWGLPCVVSKYAAEGTGLVHGQSAFVADSEEEWVSSITSLYHNEKVWNLMSEEALKIVGRDFSMGSGMKRLKKALDFVQGISEDGAEATQ